MRAMISIGCFHLYLPSNGDLKNVAALLGSVIVPLNSLRARVSGDVMAALISSISLSQSKELLLDDDVDGHARDYRFLVRPESKSVRVEDGRGNEIFKGDIEALVSWAANPSQKYLRKVVQFNYRSGSNPGALRTIRVEKVTPGKDGGSFEGIDLDKADFSSWGEGKKEGYRKYLLKRISGDIRVLN